MLLYIIDKASTPSTDLSQQRRVTLSKIVFLIVFCLRDVYSCLSLSLSKHSYIKAYNTIRNLISPYLKYIIIIQCTYRHSLEKVVKFVD